MGRVFLNTGWRRLRDRISALLWLRRQDGFLLMFRLENSELLERRFKAAGYAHLLSVLSARIGVALDARWQDAPVPQGTFAVALTGMSQTEAMEAARHLQQKGEQRLTVSGQSMTPVLSAVLLPRPAVRSGDAELIAYGCKLLDQLDTTRIGQISQISRMHPNVDSPVEEPHNSDQEPVEQFRALFQPLICCYSERVCGFDMHSLASGNTAADATSPHSRHYIGQAISFQAVLRHAMLALRRWDKVDADIPRVSVDVPGSELSRPGFADWMRLELAAMKMPPSRLALRISGDDMAALPSQVLCTNICNLRNIGCRIELCGFGIEPTGLETLRMITVDAIRIDHRYVFCCDTDPKQQQTIRAVLAMAEQMGVEVVAAGVESVQEQVCLVQLGCQEIQGCAIAPPMFLEETFDFVAARRGGAAVRRDFVSRQIG